MGLPECWRRWDIAHALGHHILHQGNQLWLQGWQRVSLWKQEREAEEFAAHFLMPEGELLKLTPLPLWELAEYFGVPQQMVEVRLTLFASRESQVSR